MRGFSRKVTETMKATTYSQVLGKAIQHVKNETMAPMELRCKDGSIVTVQPGDSATCEQGFTKQRFPGFTGWRAI